MKSRGRKQRARCPGCAACLSEEQIRARIETPRQVGFWGQTYTVTPALVPTIFGDGKAWLHLEPLNTRPDYYVVRIGADVTEDSIYDLLDDIYDAIAEQWGDTQNYECDCEPRVEWCAECRPGWPALSSDSGSGWGLVDPYLPETDCDGKGVLPAKRSPAPAVGGAR